jgi:hypothetical protein
MIGSPPSATLHPDVACAIALGVVDDPNVTASLETLTVVDARLRTTHSQPGWLDGADALSVATREYLTARRDAMLNGPRRTQSGWAASAAIKARETANIRANQARNTALKILQDRGVLHHARRNGMTVRDLN